MKQRFENTFEKSVSYEKERMKRVSNIRIKTNTI